MGAYRRDRINEEIMHTLSEILRDVKDYRLKDIDITRPVSTNKTI